MENVMLKDKTVAWPRMKTNIFRVVIVALVSSMPLTLLAETHDSVPCSVKLKFEEDQTGALAVYTLSMQVKNPTMRAIETVSALMYDLNGASMGNTDAACRHNETLLNGGDTGECSKVLQIVNSKLMEKLGNEMWTAIVSQMTVSCRRPRPLGGTSYEYCDLSLNINFEGCRMSPTFVERVVG